MKAFIGIMASSSRANRQPEVATTQEEDKQRVRIEITSLFFVVDELTAKNHWIQLERTRMKEKFNLLRSITNAMMAEEQSNSTTEAQSTLQLYANTIRELLRRP